MPAKKKKQVKKTTAKKVAKKPAKKAKAVKAVSKQQRTYIAFVIDYSSSMNSIQAETIEHVNEQIERIQKESVGMDTRVTLVKFNDDVTCEYFNKPLSKLKPLTLRTYRPNGNTAMFDAVGHTVDRMVAELKDLESEENTAALVVVVSDGQENASKRYSREQVAHRISSLQNSKKWTFTYLGANQDLSQIHNDLNIPLGNISAFVANAQGMQKATAMSVHSTGQYMQSRSRGETQTMSYYTDPNVMKPGESSSK